MKLSALTQLALLGLAAASPTPSGHGNNKAPSCKADPLTLSLTDGPYDNYFYSDCNVAAQAVVRSPLPESDPSRISPRLIVAWPAGDSGVCAFFEPQHGPNGSLAIEMVNSTFGNPLAPVYTPAKHSSSDYPSVGVQGVMKFNASATLTVPILGSIRTIRDFVEGPSILRPVIQDANQFSEHGNGASVHRLWLDNVTTSAMHFTPVHRGKRNGQVSVSGRTLKFEAGEYLVSAEMDYPQLTQLAPKEVVNSESQDLVAEQPGTTTALSFLSYSEKLLAGAWRFLTYFGRDSMIAALLLEPVLSDGQSGAMEAVIGAVLERINRSDGAACHEETIG